MKILLHTCCAPCMTYPLEVLSEHGYEVVPYFYNPNIHPFREYEKRYLAVLDYCRGQGVDLRVGPYEMEQFLLEVSPRVDSRCELCFRMRLSRAAEQARILGIGEFTSTLLVSPYQDQRLVRAAGEAAAIEHGVIFVFEDMREGYQETVSRSRELGIYRQSYCGCVYSEKERYQKGDPPCR
jgi:predicted adenine nucleotide alpha hydrolase (AANH) superfamily ATPase